MTDSDDFGHVVALRVPGGLARFQKVQVSLVTSAHTGRELEVVDAESVLPAEVASALSEALGVVGAQLSSEDGRVWDAARRSESFSDPDGPRRVVLELREVEQLLASKVRLAGVTLVPLTYKEDVDDETGALIVRLRTRLDEQQVGQWRALMEAEHDETHYYDVQRVEVEDRVVRMRLGRTYWSPADDGVEAWITLVEERHDTSSSRTPFPQINEPDLTHALRWAKRSEAGLDALLEELTAAGVLTEEAVERVQSRRAGARRALTWAGSEVDDLDDFV